MDKRGVFAILVILLSTLIYAAPSSTVDIQPGTIYETNSLLFNLTIDNLFENEVIEEIRIDVPQFTISGVVNIGGWQSLFSSNQVIWNTGDIETNSIALFQYFADAGLVSTDTLVNIDVTTTGESGEQTLDVVQVMVLNDITSPFLSSSIPVDNGFLRQGILNQLVSVDVVDTETGVLNASFSYWDCSSGAVNVTTSNTILNCVGNTCNSTIDLTSYQEGDSMCFEFSSYNNALDETLLAGISGFDGTAPVVSLDLPNDNAVLSGDIAFIFNATDNLAPTLSCDLLFENIIRNTSIVTSGQTNAINYFVSNLTEGAHAWKINCTDMVGLSGESSERNIIAGQGPIISFNIGMVERSVNYLINATITDFTSVSNAYAVVNNNTIGLTGNQDDYTGILITNTSNVLGNYTLDIFASDPWAFSTQNTYTFTLVPGYITTLSLSSLTAEPGEQITLSGTVTLEDGSNIPETYLTLTLPNGLVNVSIVNGTFNHIFNISIAGVYTLTTSIVSSNGFDHQSTIDITIGQPITTSSSSSDESSSSSSGGVGGTAYCGDGICQGFESYNSCSSDCDKPLEPEQEEEQVGSQETNEVSAEEERSPAGIGAASGFFTDVVSNPWSWAALLVIIGSLWVMSSTGGKKEKINWKGYFK